MNAILKTLALAAVTLAAGTAQAYDFAAGGLCYNITGQSPRTVEVTYQSKIAADNYFSEIITVPSRVSYQDSTYSVTAVGDFAFMGCRGVQSVTLPSTITSIGDYAFAWCESMDSITIPGNVKSLGTCAFVDCYNMVKAKVPTSIRTIGVAAFAGCQRLAEISVPGNLSEIEDNTFGSCKSLKSITIPDDVTRIGRDAFSGCQGLTSITIPMDVELIDDHAFNKCGGLRQVTVLCQTVPECRLKVWENIDMKKCVLTVPRGTRQAYLTAPGWADFTKIQEEE